MPTKEYVMLCYVMLYYMYVMLCYVMLCYITCMLCYLAEHITSQPITALCVCDQVKKTYGALRLQLLRDFNCISHI